jgi:hypothetical protein
MGGVFNTHERGEKCTQNLVGKPEGRDHVGDLTSIRK